METECFFSNNSLALTVSSFIFFVTLYMVAKQWMGFSVTLLFLCFSMIAGLIIANLDVLRNGISGIPSEHAKEADIKIVNFQEQVLKSYDGLKAELELQKHKLQNLSDEFEAFKELYKNNLDDWAAPKPRG